MATGKARWRPLLGDELAKRVARLGVDDPAEFCRDAVARAVTREEAINTAGAVAAKAMREQARCSHPEARRIHQRCGACGARGLPVVARAPAAPAKR